MTNAVERARERIASCAESFNAALVGQKGQQSPAASEQAPAAEPPPLAPIERVVEIFERFLPHEPELTAELIGEVARCDTSALA
jgi:hypothetical protein